jgi:predicted dehydrogenase
MNVGLIGYGYWGPKIARNIFQLKDCKLVRVTDINPERLVSLKESSFDIAATTENEDIFRDDNIESVVISSYASTHYNLAKKALEVGKNVLVEKPLTTSRRQAEELLNLSLKKNLTLMIDYTYLYSNAILEIKKILKEPGFEKIKVVESNRSNFGWIRNDVNVMFDLATHDISILSFVLDKKPVTVRAIGFKLQGKLEQISQIFLHYADGCYASVYCSWISPYKVRKMNFITGEKSICYDDLSQGSKVEIFDNNVSWHPVDDDLLLDAQIQKTSLYIKFEEPLFSMVSEFKQAVTYKSIPRSNINLGLDVIHILEKAWESMNQGGKEIEI